MWIVSLGALFAASVAPAQELLAEPFGRDVPVSLAADEVWSWHGLPQGRQEAWGVPYYVLGPGPAGELARASATNLAGPAAVVYALISPVVPNHLASVEFGCRSGRSISIPAEKGALAWAAEEPHRRRLLLVRGEAPVGDPIVRVKPVGCYLFALVVGDAAAAGDEELKALYARGQEAWEKRFLAEAPPLWLLQQTVDAIPDRRIAILPPTGAEPAVLTTVLSQTRLRGKLVALKAEDLLDPARFSAELYPLALYVGSERHLRTIREPNDASDAVIRYLAEGGTIVMATSMPYPTYYAIDAGEPAPFPNQPLLRRLGIDIVAAFERPPEGSQLTIHPVEGQTVLPSVDESWPYPTTGDLRLRCFGVPDGERARMTSILEVRGAEGKPVGPCAALFELGAEGNTAGTILYIWSGVVNDVRVAEGVVCDLVRWIAERTGPG